MADTEVRNDLWRLRAVFERAQHAVALFDGRGRVTDWNPAAARLTGWEPADVMGKDLAWLHGHDERPWSPTALERAAAGGTVANAGWRRRRDGSRFWCEATLHGLRDDEQVLRGLVETFTDATEFKTAQEALGTVPELFVRALRTAPIGVAIQDADLRYTWAPMGAGTLGGRDDRDPIGLTDADLFAPAEAARLTALKREALATGRGTRSEIAVDGRHLDVTIEPLHGPDGAATGVSTVAFDVTDRKHAQDEVERSRERLAEAERVARFGSWEWDVAENRVVWSDGLFAVYGVDPADFDERYRPSSERVHPEDRERVDAAVQHALASGDPIDLEYRILRPDGRVRRVRGRAEVIVGADGRPVRFTGTVQDVTEMRATAEALQQTAADLGRQAAELHRLTSTAATGERDFTQSLTPRQLQILALVAEGLSNGEIGARLYLSEGTVKWHVRKILRALGVTNRAQAVARYLASD